MLSDTIPGRTIVRPAVPGDVDAIVAVENACWERPWLNRVLTSQELRRYVREATATLLVAECNSGLVGWAILEPSARPHGRQLILMRAAVHPDQRRHGVGRQLVEECKRVAVARECISLRALLEEHEVEAQIFLRECGLRYIMTTVMEGDAVHPDETCYVLQYNPREFVCGR